MTRTGKIARLPRIIRDPLNQRLHDGEPGNQLLEWLNALAEVQAVLAAEFEGRPINAQNLTDWKQGGYRDWVAQQEALDLAQRLGEDAAELQAEGRPPLTDTLALWLAARYAVATRQVAQAEGAEGWRALRELCADIVELRRGDHSAERLRLEREQFDLERQRERERTETELWEWADRPEIRRRILQRIETEKEKHKQDALNLKRVRMILFGSAPDGGPLMGSDSELETEEDPANSENEASQPPTHVGSHLESNQGESSLIKPNQAPMPDPEGFPPA